MKEVTVLPLSTKIRTEELSYFSAKDIVPGMIVTVPVRKKIHHALVIGTHEVRAAKATIKNSAFNLRKITSVKGMAHFPESFFKACEETCSYFLGAPSAVFGELIPTLFLEQYEKLIVATQIEKPLETRDTVQEKLIFQAPLDDRLSYYRTFIREAFARKQSVFICLPTVADIKTFSESLGRGIEQYTFVFHSERTKKELLEAYNRTTAETHPVLIIATVPYLSIPRFDLGTIVVEHESSGAYRSMHGSTIDFRIFAEIFAHEQKLRFIIADTLLRAETMYKFDSREIGEVSAPVFRMSHTTEEIIIDPSQNAPVAKKKFSSITPQVREAIEEAHESKKKIFLFTLRTGLATSTICRDCGTLVTCPTCQTPLVLYERSGVRIYTCNRCQHDFDATRTCTVCQSWNLAPLGIGIEYVFNELKKDFPHIPIFRIDREVVRTASAAQKVMKQFERAEGGILLGTEMALFYLNQSVDTTAVISFDSLFNIASYRINERILELLVMLRSITERRIFIQTRNPNDPILYVKNSGNLRQWYQEELTLRERLRYPPFVVLIKLSFRGKPSAQNLEKNRLMQIFEGEKISIIEGRARKGRAVGFHALVRVHGSRWSTPGLRHKGERDPKLLSAIETAGQNYAVEINPEDLF